MESQTPSTFELLHNSRWLLVDQKGVYDSWKLFADETYPTDILTFYEDLLQSLSLNSLHNRQGGTWTWSLHGQELHLSTSDKWNIQEITQETLTLEKLGYLFHYQRIQPEKLPAPDEESLTNLICGYIWNLDDGATTRHRTLFQFLKEKLDLGPYFKEEFLLLLRIGLQPQLSTRPITEISGWKLISLPNIWVLTILDVDRPATNYLLHECSNNKLVFQGKAELVLRRPG